MIIKHTRDTLSKTYLDAVAIRNTVFVKGQGVPRSIEIDANEALQVGEKLPSERQLAEMMQVSRAVVNSGISELEKKGG